MPSITTGDGTEIYYKDSQMLFFLEHGYRVIAHDRRGHGRSSQTGGGHDMDHYADDLAALTAIST